jgi:cation transport ATPase
MDHTGPQLSGIGYFRIATRSSSGHRRLSGAPLPHTAIPASDGKRASSLKYALASALLRWSASSRDGGGATRCGGRWWALKSSSNVFARGQAARSSSTASRSQETWIALLSIGAITLHLVLKFAISASSAFSVLPLYIALLIGGVVLLRNLGRDILNREIGADGLAGSSIITATVLGEHLFATIIVLMLSGGTALEHYATRRASSVLAALARRIPRTAHRRIDGRLVDVSLDAITVGEALVVLPHEVCPVNAVLAIPREPLRDF